MLTETSIMSRIREELEAYIPPIVLDIFLIIIMLGFCTLFVKYNVAILRLLGKFMRKMQEMVYKLTSKTATEANKKMHQAALIHSDKPTSQIVQYFDALIVDMDLYKDGVTAFGLISFLVIVSLIFTLILSAFFNFGNLFILAFAAVSYVVFTVFKVVAMSKVEHREALIMDVEDLLVSDISGGVYNVIVRYKDRNINPEIAGYFHSFVDNISQNGWSFNQAMQQLNKELGPTFTDFATKAMLYESTADKETLEIFSSVIDINAHKRRLREQNNIIFAQVRAAFLICLGITIATLVIMCFSDVYVRHFFVEMPIGRALIIFDVFLVAWALSKLSALKAQKY